MNCWKTINLSRDLGSHRLIIVSFLVMFAAFIMMYLPLSLINENTPLNDDQPLLFIFSLFILIPFRLICYAIPAWIGFKKIKVKMNMFSRFFPTFKIEFSYSVAKPLKIISILAPTLFITIPLVIASIYFPEYMHYVSIIAAVNIGLSVTDFIYVYILIKAPRHCFVEETNNSFDILIQQNR